MMKTLIVYDSNGTVISTLQSDDLSGATSLVANVPEGKVVSHIDMETGEAVIIDAPVIGPTYDELMEAYTILTGGEEIE